MTAIDYRELLEHFGHRLEIGKYINPRTGRVSSVTIECMTCCEVLIDVYDAGNDLSSTH